MEKNNDTNSTSPSPSDSVHLLVLCHGMWGNVRHLAQMAQTVKEERPEFHVLLPETNQEDSTYDGVDWGGERVAREILEEISRLRSQGKIVRQFSITGYSLGGLISRYVVGILHQRGLFSPDSSEYIIPVNFNTVATPHLGLIKYNSFFSTLSRSIGSRLLSRTGEQFYCVDNWGTSGRPLLDVLSDPSLIFYQALAQFQHVRVYANAINDLTVPYVTAAIETEDPFAEYETNGLEIQFNSNYHPLVTSYSLSPVPPPKPKSKSWLRKPKPSLSDSPSSSDNPSRPAKEKTPLLPPFLQYRFPFNLLIYASIPLLIPTFISLALVRLTRASRSSKERITLLENGASDSELAHTSLARALASLEVQVEGALADFIIENPSSPLTVPQLHPSAHPILTPLQKTISARLNSLPQLKKEIVFITGMRNCHSTIISREKVWDPKGYGINVLKHWAGMLISSAA